MASRTTMTRDISTIFLVVLTISGTICGLPLAGIDGGNKDGQMFPADMPPPPPGAFADPGVEVSPPKKLPEPRSGEVAPQSDDGFDVDTPVEVAGVAGTGLAMMGNMFPDNMPPPPPGAVNDEVPQLGQEVHASNGNMFPDNMPPPPPRAVNDEPLQLGQEVPVINGNMFPDNMPPPPPGAVNDEVPASNGNMFPDNMPPPPPGAVNDEVPQLGQVVPNFGQAVPVSNHDNGNMFPDNMPPPPAGAFNDEGAPFSVEGIEPRQMEVNQDNAALPNQEPVPQYRGMFPPNMPPPPPGAFNDPPPVPALPSDGTAVEPVYVTGMEVPEAAVVPPGDQTPFIDPNQRSPVPSNQQYIPPAEEPINIPQYNPDNVASNYQNTPYLQPAGSPQGLTPNTQDNPEGQVPYNPDEIDDSNSPIPNEDNQPAESVPAQNEAQASYNPNLPDPNPNPSAQLERNQDIPANSATTHVEGQSHVNEYPSASPSESWYESSYESYEEEQNNVDGNSQAWSPESTDSFTEENQEEASSEEWEESDTDYSFMDFLQSAIDSSDYEFTENEEGDNTLWEDTESEDYSETASSYLEDSSEYSDLDWIFNDSDESSWGAGGESSEEEEEEEEDGGYFGGDETEEVNHHENEQEQTYPNGYSDAIGMENDLYRTGGTRLIVYCIPALILSVLVLLAWKNYKGRIRVVTVPSGDAKQYDWKSDRKSEEHAPMLLDQDEREY